MAGNPSSLSRVAAWQAPPRAREAQGRPARAAPGPSALRSCPSFAPPEPPRLPPPASSAAVCPAARRLRRSPLDPEPPPLPSPATAPRAPCVAGDRASPPPTSAATGAFLAFVPRAPPRLLAARARIRRDPGRGGPRRLDPPPRTPATFPVAPAAVASNSGVLFGEIRLASKSVQKP
nr:formin-like protein 5 [Aegilops tauschii subsp. strangulata]